MDNIDFVWADLSTYHLDQAKIFYARVFGWLYKAQGNYHYTYTGNKLAAGLYTMPAKFQQMQLPSFWMSYIRVPDIEQVVARAEEKDGIIEVQPTDFQGQGKVALIRDPAGAGFTVWQGADLGGKIDDNTHGRMVQNELYVSDANLVLDFYQHVFGWIFIPDANHGTRRYTIQNAGGKAIAALEQIPNEIKGKAEFWAVYFTVRNMETAHTTIRNNGGEIITEMNSSQGRLTLAQDPAGAVFMLTENPHASVGLVSWLRFDLLTIIALIVIYVAVIFDLQWMWGVLFLLWLIPDIRSGQTYLVQPVNRLTNPILYWVIVLSWLWMAIYLLSTLFA